MEEQLGPLAATHLLQHTLRSLCVHESSQWVYAVFWRILPRNFPPPKWDFHGGGYGRSRGNRRNWILVWEDGFCNFAAASSSSDDAGGCGAVLHPELFFKLSHEIYSYGEGLIGRVASDGSHKWVFKQLHDLQPSEIETGRAAAADPQPRTWGAQFHSGIKTIALVAVKEGVVQLGAVNKVLEDLNLVMQLRSRFSYLESIPGVLLPHPSSSPLPVEAVEGGFVAGEMIGSFGGEMSPTTRVFVPSMSSLDILMSRLPSVVVPASAPSPPSSSSSVSYNNEMPAFAGDDAGRRPPAPDAAMNVMEEEMVGGAYERDEVMFELGGRRSSISHYYLHVGN